MKKCKTYILKTKDIPLIEFSLMESTIFVKGMKQTNHSLQIEKVLDNNSHLFPKNLSRPDNGESLMDWILGRKAPKNRQFVEKIISAIGDDNNPMKYVNVTHAVSLNDAYWIDDKGNPSTWKNINLYQHQFDEILAEVAFTGHSYKVSGIITTPELTSSGMLKKCWSNRPDGIYLLKGDNFIVRSDKRSQATIEFYASQVADAMGIEHISYDLELFKHRNKTKEIVCKCKLFTSEDIGFIDGATFLKSVNIDFNKTNILSQLSFQERLAAVFGEKEYGDMMLFDSIIANTDRHLGNFGMLIDNNTNKPIKMAPVFDNGFSLLYSAADYDLSEKGFDDYVKTLRCKYMSFDEQAAFFVEHRHLKALQKLTTFKFTEHPNPECNISDSTLAVMEKFIHERAAKTIKLLIKKEKLRKNTKARKPGQGIKTLGRGKETVKENSR